MRKILQKTRRKIDRNAKVVTDLEYLEDLKIKETSNTKTKNLKLNHVKRLRLIMIEASTMTMKYQKKLKVKRLKVTRKKMLFNGGTATLFFFIRTIL